MDLGRVAIMCVEGKLEGGGGVMMDANKEYFFL